MEGNHFTIAGGEANMGLAPTKNPGVRAGAGDIEMGPHPSVGILANRSKPVQPRRNVHWAFYLVHRQAFLGSSVHYRGIDDNIHFAWIITKQGWTE